MGIEKPIDLIDLVEICLKSQTRQQGLEVYDFSATAKYICVTYGHILLDVYEKNRETFSEIVSQLSEALYTGQRGIQITNSAVTVIDFTAKDFSRVSEQFNSTLQQLANYEDNISPLCLLSVGGITEVMKEIVDNYNHYWLQDDVRACGYIEPVMVYAICKICVFLAKNPHNDNLQQLTGLDIIKRAAEITDNILLTRALRLNKRRLKDNLLAQYDQAEV